MSSLHPYFSPPSSLSPSSQIVQLEDNKKRAVSSKDFREAGRLAAELKTKSAEKSEIDQFLSAKQADNDTGGQNIEEIRNKLASLREENKALEATIAYCRVRKLEFITAELTEEIERSGSIEESVPVLFVVTAHCSNISLSLFVSRAAKLEDFERAQALQEEMDVIKGEIELLEKQ